MNLESVNKGIYPTKPFFNSNSEKYAFVGMLLFSVVVYFNIACWYVWNGQ